MIEDIQTSIEESLDFMGKKLIGDGSPIHVMFGDPRFLLVQEMATNIKSNPRQQGDRTDRQVDMNCCSGKALEFALEDRSGFVRKEPSDGGPIWPGAPEEWAADLHCIELECSLQVKSWGPRTSFSIDSDMLNEFREYGKFYEYIVAGKVEMLEDRFQVHPMLVFPTKFLRRYLLRSDNMKPGQYYFDHRAALINGHCIINQTLSETEIQR